MKEVTLFESLFGKRVWVMHFDGRIHKEVTKVVNGIRYISAFRWCGNWYPANEDGTFNTDGCHFQYNWSFSYDDLKRISSTLIDDRRRKGL